MGQMTFANIVSEALLIVGDTSLTTRANVWLNNGLARLYRSHAWPFLSARSESVTLASGAASVTLGDGEAALTDLIVSIERLAIAESSNAGYKADLPITTRYTVDPSQDPAWLDTLAPGTPTSALVEPVSTSPWKWTVKPAPIPNVAFRLNVTYIRRPANDPATPLYPSDDTLIQLVKSEALEHMNLKKEALEARAVLRGLVSEDKAAYGRASQGNSTVAMNRSRFPRWRHH